MTDPDWMKRHRRNAHSLKMIFLADGDIQGSDPQSIAQGMMSYEYQRGRKEILDTLAPFSSGQICPGFRHAMQRLLALWEKETTP